MFLPVLFVKRIFIDFFVPVFTKIQPGEVSEWLKEHAWKVCIPERVSRVRIPPSPQIHCPANRRGFIFLFRSVAELARAKARNKNKKGTTVPRWYWI
jgi:hypothetical protein